MERYSDALADTEASLVLNPASYKALRTRARIHLHLERFDNAVADFKAATEQAEIEGSDADVRALKNELKKAEVALKRSKTKDYYKILGKCICSRPHCLVLNGIQVSLENALKSRSRKRTAKRV